MNGSDDSLTQVFKGSRNEAEVIRGVLESAEIPTAIGHSGAAVAYGINVGPLGQSSVSVPSGRVDEARALLAEFQPQEHEVATPSMRLTVIKWAAILALIVSVVTIIGPVADGAPR